MSETGSRALFERALRAAGVTFEGDEIVINESTLGAFHRALDTAIKAEAAGEDYGKAKTRFFARHPDIHRIYLNHEPPVHFKGGQ